MIAFATGILLVCASAAGWLLLCLVILDVVRYRRRLRNWKPDPPRRDEGGPI